MNEKDIIASLKQIVTPQFCNALAKQVKLVKRSTSRIEGFEIAQVLCLPRKAESLNDMCDRLKEINPDCQMSAPALLKRINQAAMENFMRGCMAHLMKEIYKKSFNEEISHILKPFGSVILEDSTNGELNKKLRKKFKGASGKASRAGFKVDFIYEYKNQNILNFTLTDRRVNDQSLSSRILKWISPGDLIIRDLGYFATKVFAKIHQVGAFFLSRFKSDVHVYLNKEDKQPVCLHKRLSQFKGVVDLNVFIGEQERLQVRLIAYPTPKDIVNKRLRKMHRNAKRRGRTLSKQTIVLQNWTIFITNVPEETLKPELIGTIYRLRWEIELHFKRWKSALHFDDLKGENPHRIISLIIGRLCMILCLGIIERWALSYAEKILKREISLMKLWNFLLKNDRLFNHFNNQTFERLIEEIKEKMSKLCKDKRKKRKTILEKLRTYEGYNQEQKKLEYKKESAMAA